METLKLKNINLKGGYRIELSQNANGNPTAKSMRLLSSGINKGQYKIMENYRFRSEQQRESWVKEVIERLVSRANEKAQQIAAKQDAQMNMKHSFEVGQVLYDSWGYDQTNIDFYQIVEVLPKSIKIRPIAEEVVPGSYGHDSCRVRPVKDSFSGDVELKKIVVRVYNNQVHYHISSRHGAINIYDHGDSGVGCSWGH